MNSDEITCKCGCGLVGPRLDKWGRPREFLAKGHGARRPLAERFWEKVDRENGPISEIIGTRCWIWTAAKRMDGYGVIGFQDRTFGAHRISWFLHTGIMSDKQTTIDHLCRHPSCVRPDHLEYVPVRINVLRGIGPAAKYAKRTHCGKGHPYSEDNLVMADLRTGRRRCRICHNKYRRQS